MMYRLTHRFSRMAVLTGALLVATSWGCQQSGPGDTVRIGEIRADPTKFAGFNVVVRGVMQSEEPPEKSSFGRGYMFRDRYADVILVRTTNEVPEPGSEWLVTGTVVNRGPDLFIGEATRRRVGFDWQESRTIILFAIGAVLVVLLGLIGGALLRPEAPDTGAGLGAGPFLPGGEGDGGSSRPPDFGLTSDVTKTVPLPGGLTATYGRTRRLLPGILAVLDGGRAQGHLYLYSQDGGDQVAIGRKSPDVSTGIRIDDPTATLSRHQASIRYFSGEDRFQIKNGNAVNPTVLNDRPMGSEEVADLPYDTTLSMGALNFKFVQKL